MDSSSGDNLGRKNVRPYSANGLAVHIHKALNVELLGWRHAVVVLLRDSTELKSNHINGLNRHHSFGIQYATSSHLYLWRFTQLLSTGVFDTLNFDLLSCIHSETLVLISGYFRMFIWILQAALWTRYLSNGPSSTLIALLQHLRNTVYV